MSQSHKLIVSLTSPYARKARIVALEKKIDFEMVVDVPWNEDTGVTKVNPLGKVPVWITKEGEALYDSRVITEYLELLGGPSFFPADPMARIKVKRIEALAEGVMDASLVLFAERRKRPSELQHQWWIDRQFGKVHRGLKQLNEELGDKPYFFGNSFSMADVAVVAALGYVGLRFSEDFNWQQKYPQLAAFYNRLMERPSVKDTVPVV